MSGLPTQPQRALAQKPSGTRPGFHRRRSHRTCEPNCPHCKGPRASRWILAWVLWAEFCLYVGGRKLEFSLASDEPADCPDTQGKTKLGNSLRESCHAPCAGRSPVGRVETRAQHCPVLSGREDRARKPQPPQDHPPRRRCGCHRRPPAPMVAPAPPQAAASPGWCPLSARRTKSRMATPGARDGARYQPAGRPSGRTSVPRRCPTGPPGTDPCRRKRQAGPPLRHVRRRATTS
eukprot:scaffold1302_cov114-Isochrysis_galbana.AAC.3